MPGAAYIVWIMSSMSCWMSGVISATGCGGLVEDVGAVTDESDAASMDQRRSRAP